VRTTSSCCNIHQVRSKPKYEYSLLPTILACKIQINIKLQLLPEKRHKCKTRVLRKTLNPQYDETFTFYGINPNQLPDITLHFVVLSFDRFSRDDIIGEVVHPLKDFDVSKNEMNLCKEISPRHLTVSLQYFVFNI